VERDTTARESGEASRTLCDVPTDLSESELERYSEQIERIGVEGQLRLKSARAIVIGAGPAGSSAAAELVSRGMGYVAVVDGARTALGDLCGQAALYTPDIGANRAEAIAAKLGILNPNVQVDPYPVDVDEANAAAIVMGHDVALDFSRAAAGALVAACAEHGVELISADSTGTVAGVIAAGAAISHVAAGVPAAEGAR
jgi:molybdopterin/thiamine biosynthesis adenylyltransferase